MKRRETQKSHDRLAQTARRRIRIFRRNEDGSILIFSVLMFTLMLLVAGISLDIERFETARTKLQATADGAVLVGASLTQNVYPVDDVVTDYIVKAGMGAFLEDVDVVSDVNYRRVTVEADVNVPTHFFNMIGVENLHTVVTSVAEESIGNVEISMVLDVSGSMGWGSKLSNLKDAGEDFIDGIYQFAATGSVSTSIVPYSTQVSAGPDILAYFTDREETHDNSHCLNFEDTEFTSTALVPTDNVEQALHFDPWTDENSSWSANNNLWSVVCPTAAWTDILLYQENITTLKNYINAFQATNWTSIELGVKWGAAILDPAFRPVVNGFITAGDVSADFTDRPMSYTEANGLKVLIVMTDGENTEHYEMEDPYRSGDSFVYVYYDAYDRPYYSIWGGTGDPDPTVRTETVTETNWNCTYWYRRYGRWRCGNWEEVTTQYEQEIEDWYLANDYSNDGVSDGWRSAPYGLDDATRMTWNQLWAEVPVEYFTDEYLRDMGYSSTVRNEIEDARTYINRPEKDDRTLDICNAAKNQGILVYTIGFEAPTAAETLLRNCATTVSHFFDVDGTEISQAFSAIAADINRLRLTQ